MQVIFLHDTWKSLNDNHIDSAVINFDFQPLHEPGVITKNITEESGAIDCFIELFSDTELNST